MKGQFVSWWTCNRNASFQVVVMV